MTTLIKGGTVVTSIGADPAEVLIDGSSVSAVLQPGTDIALAAEAPAEVGVITPGADADVVIYDPNARWSISVDNHHMNMDYSAFEGMKVTGHVDTVLLRGKVTVDDGHYLGMAGDGRYLRRSLCQYLQ